MIKRLLVLILFMVFSLPAMGFAERASRLALVIGNGEYKSAPLQNPINDADDMATVLRALGFEVIYRKNANQKTMKSAIREFGKRLRKKGGVGLFYYSGHGIQIKGVNYLIPIDIHIESEADVEYDAVNSGLVLGKMEDAGNDVNIVILDACRDNPYTRSFRTTSRGLARMDAPRGSLIVYSTAPGSVAADGEERNGTYTKYLLKHITVPGLKVEEVLKRVRLDVVNETGNKQVPWESSSMTGEFYFTGQPDVSARIKIDTQQPKPQSQSIIEVDTTIREAVGYYLGTEGIVDEEKAKALFLAASEQGNPLGTMWVAHCYQNGRCGFPLDEKRAQELAEEVIESVKSSAGENNTQSMFLLASAYSDGLAVAPDDENAVFWLRKAADKRDAGAMSNLCFMYSKGKGVAPDNEKAVYWCRKAADKGNVYAMNNLGWMYLQGSGVPTDYEKAVFWYRKAADKGFAEAMSGLGLMYDEGWGVAPDYEKAIYWYHRAAEKGHADAMNNLGWMYEQGRGVAPDNEKAVYWYRKAANDGDAKAMYNLGVMYTDGSGVALDDDKAVYWYRKAAEKGNANAMDNLGWMYQQGRGVAYDGEKAAYWYRKAAEKRNAAGREDFVNLRLKHPKPGCFIATAAYGAEGRKQVVTLRRFRDRWLLGNVTGRWLVRHYYRLSPSIADAIAERPRMKKIARAALTPMVILAGAAVGSVTDIFLLCFFTLVTLILFRFIIQSRGRKTCKSSTTDLP